ncbi:MAG: chemotaxis protein CheR, partial [Nitrospinaceae bacterium]|nr:chemotaxis protein CheR [Nitrospinaceae bacterium]NIU96364.1 chemotaxis protein CheR [Nitrospinaceae bacterium]
RAWLRHHPDEWACLDALCRITLSRFYRDRAVFDALGDEVLPRLVDRLGSAAPVLRCWSAGCASGEESYSLVLLWHFGPGRRFPGVRLDLVATDADRNLLDRARSAHYPGSSVKDLPPSWRDTAFDLENGIYRLKKKFISRVRFLQQDLRQDAPAGPFHLVLCRNLAFTYFQPRLQHQALDRIRGALVEGGGLVLGAHESLPPTATDFCRPQPHLPIYFRQSAPPPAPSTLRPGSG